MKQKLMVGMSQPLSWGVIQSAPAPALVQIYAQIIPFDWYEPYRMTDQYEAYGTGFFINSQGYILTNMHVIDQAATVWIYSHLLGRQPLPVDIVSICPDRDLALLRLSDEGMRVLQQVAQSIPHVLFGDSDFVQRADEIMVMGYPLGQHRLKSTIGVMSGKELMGNQPVLQITAPINPGSSGGPLFDIQGQVIGVAMALVPDAQNVGYGLPSSEILAIIDDMYTNPLVKKPSLGVRFVYGNDAKSAYFKNPGPAGIYITSVFKGSLFDKAGIKKGDMLVSFAGYQIDAFGEAHVPWSQDKVSLVDLIARMKLHEFIEVIIYRAGIKKEFSIKVEVTDHFEIKKRYPSYESIDYEIVAGLVIMELCDDHIELFSQTRSEIALFMRPEYRMKGVLVVSQIIAGSYAHQARILYAGDIISTVQGVAVKSLKQLRSALRRNVNRSFVQIETIDDVTMVMSVDQVIASEKRVQELHIAPETVLMKYLKNIWTKGILKG